MTTSRSCNHLARGAWLGLLLVAVGPLAALAQTEDLPWRRGERAPASDSGRPYVRPLERRDDEEVPAYRRWQPEERYQRGGEPTTIPPARPYESAQPPPAPGRAAARRDDAYRPPQQPYQAPRAPRGDDAYRPAPRPRTDDVYRPAPRYQGEDDVYRPRETYRPQAPGGYGEPYSPPPQAYDPDEESYTPPPPYRERPPPPRRSADPGRLEVYTIEEIRDAGHGFFGSVSQGLARVIEYAFQRSGRPNGYILGEEASGAFIAGLRYGEGMLYTRDGRAQKVYWQGPSLGFDAGAEGAKVMILVYNLRDPDEVYQTYGGVAGSAYLVAGVGITFHANDEVVMAPIRAGIGLRLGANVGYLKYTRRPTWNPF